MLVTLVPLRPTHIRLEVLAIFSLLSELSSRPMLSLGNFVRKLFFSGLLDIQLLELILGSFLHGFISQEHVVIFGPELLGLLEMESGLIARGPFMWLVFPPLLGHVAFGEFR